MKRHGALTLAVLAVLRDQPMHPYELLQEMRPRYWDRLFGATTGSVYRAVERLTQQGLVEAREPTRKGRRPERTVYALTSAGEQALVEQLADRLATPSEEYPDYLLALTLSFALPRVVALRELRRRVRELDRTIAGNQAVLDGAVRDGVPDRTTLDLSYHLAMLRAERAWTAQVVEDLENSRLSWADDAELAPASVVRRAFGADES